MRSGRDSLEAALGRALHEVDFRSIRTLNDLGPELTSEAAGLARESRVAAVAFLQFYVAKAELGAVASFVDDVLLGGAPVERWGRRDVLSFLCGRITEHLTEDWPAKAVQLADAEGVRWWRVVPTSDWDWTGLAGAPGVLMRDAPYWFEPPEQLEFADLDSHPDELEAVEDVVVAWRRWLANRIAYELRDSAVARSARSVEEVAELLGVRGDRLSDSARAAILALLDDGWEIDCSAQPGYRGPDSLFTNR